MKKIVYLTFMILSVFGTAQVGINTSSPDKSAALEIYATDKGMLIPRIPLTGKDDKNTITNPANGLIVYNTNEGNNGTPGVALDDVHKDNFYYFSGTENSWSLLVNDTWLVNELDKLGVPRLMLVAGFSAGKNNPVGADLGSGSEIRHVEFDNILFDRTGSYNTTNFTYTAPYAGYYQIQYNLALNSLVDITTSSYSNIYRLGVSKPASAPLTSAGNGQFAFLNQPLNNAYAADSDRLYTNFTYGVIYMEAGQMIEFLTRFIDNTKFNLSIETTSSLKRENASRLSITYFPK